MSRPLRVLVTGTRETSPAEAAHVARTLARVCADALSHARPVIIV